MSLTPNPSYLDDWKDLKEYTHQKHEAAEKEKDQRDVTKDYVGEQISDYEVKDEAKEQAEYEKIYQKIADISAGGGVDLSPYLKIDDASANFATKAEIPDVSGFITEDDLTDYAKKTDIPSVEGFVKEEDLEPYAKKTEIPDVSNFATISELNEGLAAKADKGDSYTKEESDAKYLTEHQSLDDYAKKTDIPDVSAFVTEETVDEKVDTAIAKVIADAPEDFDTLKEVADYIASDKTRAAEIEIAISNLQSQKADASTVYTKDEADAKFLTEHQDLSDYALKSDIPDISNLATKDELAEVEGKIPSVDAFATTEYVNSEIERVEEEIPDVTNLATKTEVEAVAAQIPSIEGLVTEEQLTEAVSDKATIAQVAAVDQKVDAIVVPDISNLATKAEVAEGDASVLNNVLGKIWNKSGNYFETKYSKDGKTAMVWNEYDGGGVLFDDTVNKIKTFCGVNDGGKGADAINAQIYSKDTTNNIGSRLNVNPTGIFYSVGNSAVVSPETELAVKGDIPSVEGFATEEQLTAAVADKATIAQVAAVDQKVDAIVVPDISNLATKAEVAEGDASVLNNVLSKMWNKGGDCFYSQKKVGNKTALIFNESDGGGSKFDTSELASFIGVNDGGDISTGVHVQIYSKTKADNKGARLNVNPTGIFYGVGTSAVISPETEIAVKGDIPSVDGFATEEQLTAAVADKATISQVAAVDQKVDAIDLTHYAEKTEVDALEAKIWNKSGNYFQTKYTQNGKTALLWNESDGGGTIFETSELKSFVGVNDGGDPSTGVHVQIYSKNKASNVGSRLNVNPSGIYYGVGNSVVISPETELAVKGDLNSKADADSVYTKEVCDAKFLTEHQDLSEYAKTADVSDGYVPIGEYNALVDKVKVLSAYVESFVTVDPKKREEANDTIVASLSDDNTSVVVPSEIKSIVYPETTKGLTVVAPLADDSSVQITSEKYFYLDNTSESGNTSTAINGINGATSATKCYLTGTFETLTLTNISVDKASSKNAAVVSNVVIPATNETNISISVALTEGATITNNSDKDVTISNQNGGDVEPTVYIVAPNSTVTVSGGQFGTFESTVGDSTLYINKSAHIKKLIVKKGNVIVNDYSVEDHIDEIVNDTEYTVTPKIIEVTTQSDWTKASSTPALYEVQNDLTTTTRIAPGIFGSSARIKMNSHTVTCSDANGAFVLRGSSHYIIENGKLDCAAGYGIWLAGAGTVELKDMVIDADSHALYIEKTGGNIYTTGNCRFSVKGEDKRYVANYLDATYSSGWVQKAKSTNRRCLRLD